jgi:hypothetical protein
MILALDSKLGRLRDRHRSVHRLVGNRKVGRRKTLRAAAARRSRLDLRARPSYNPPAIRRLF